MKHQKTAVRADQVTEEVSAPPRASTWRDAENEHDWNDRGWGSRCNMCGVYFDDYEPHEMPECSDKARENYENDRASEYDEAYERSRYLEGGDE